MHYKLRYLVETTKIGFGPKLTQIHIFLGKTHFSSNWPKLVFCWNFRKNIGRSPTIETFKAMSKITPPKCSVAGHLSSEQCLIFLYSATTVLPSHIMRQGYHIQRTSDSRPRSLGWAQYHRSDFHAATLRLTMSDACHIPYDLRIPPHQMLWLTISDEGTLRLTMKVVMVCCYMYFCTQY